LCESISPQASESNSLGTLGALSMCRHGGGVAPKVALFVDPDDDAWPQPGLLIFKILSFFFNPVLGSNSGSCTY
jgi:hypothetical protein